MGIEILCRFLFEFFFLFFGGEGGGAAQQRNKKYKTMDLSEVDIPATTATKRPRGPVTGVTFELAPDDGMDFVEEARAAPKAFDDFCENTKSNLKEAQVDATRNAARVAEAQAKEAKRMKKLDDENAAKEAKNVDMFDWFNRIYSVNAANAVKKEPGTLVAEEEAIDVEDAAAEGVESPLKVDPRYDFILRFTNPSGLKMLIEVLTPIIANTGFLMKKTDNFTGIYMMSQDNSNTCLIYAQLECEVACTPNQEFMVESPDLKTINKRIGARDCVEIRRLKGADGITFDIFETGQGGGEKFKKINLSTVNETLDILSCPPVLYSYAIEFKLPELRDALHTAIELKIPNVWLVVYEPKVHPTGKREFYFEIKTEASSKTNNKSFSFLYRSEMVEVPVGDDGEALIAFQAGKEAFSVDPHTDVTKMTKTYCEQFSADLVASLLAPLKRPTVCINMEPGQPLRFQYPLSDRNSFVTMLVSRIIPETDGL